MTRSMSKQSLFEQFAERVDRLLVRHAELQRTNTLLQEQLTSMTAERDALRTRLQAARSRVDALLERIPDTSAPENTP